MRLGINTYTFMWSIGFEGARPKQPMTAMGLLKEARELGVHVVQVGPNLPLDQLSESELDRFVGQAQAWDLELELGTRGLELDHLERQIALSRRIGSSLLRTVPEVGGETPSTGDLVAHVLPLLPALERAGVKLSMENGQIPAVDLRGALEFFDSPYVGVVLDTVNSLAIPEGWRHVAEVLAPYTMCLHLKDFVIRRAWHMMGFVCEGRPAGQGQVDLPWLLETLKASPYDFNVIVELWPPEQETLDATIALEQAWARESITYARRYVTE